MRNLILATATCAAVALTGAASAKTKKPEDPDKVLCRLEQASGTRIASRRICMTRAEWKMEDESRQRDAERSVRGTWDRGELEAPRNGPPF